LSVPDGIALCMSLRRRIKYQYLMRRTTLELIEAKAR
jgi:hypothetical protein